MLNSDTDLLRASASGHAASFARLVERYRSLVWAVAMSATGNAAASEELTQEAFVIAWQELAELRDADSFAAWVCGIVRNLARSSRRHERRHAPAATHGIEHLDSVPATLPSPLEQAILRQEHDLVREALAQVPAAYREPLILFYQEQKSLGEVASDLAVSEDTVKQRLCRGRKYLRREVETLMARSGTGPRRNLGAAVLATISLHRTSTPLPPAMAWSASSRAALMGWGGGSFACAMAIVLVVLSAMPAPRQPRHAARAVAAGQSVPARAPAPVLAKDSTRVAPAETWMAEVPPVRPAQRPAMKRAALRHSARPEPVWQQPLAPAPIVPIVIERGPSDVTREAEQLGPSVPPPVLEAFPLEASLHVHGEKPWERLPIDPPDLRQRILEVDL